MSIWHGRVLILVWQVLDRASIAKELPETLVRKRPARGSLQVALKFLSLPFIGKRMITDQFPWSILCSVDRATSIMSINSLF